MTVKISNPKKSVTGHKAIRTRRNVNTYTPDVMIQKNLNDTVALRFDFYFRMKFLSLLPRVIFSIQYNYSGDYRNSCALISREWRHIPL